MSELHDHSAVTYHKTAAAEESGYVVHRNGTPIGYVRRSQNGPGWAYTLDLDGTWTWVQHSTRREATDHLLSACSPSAAWLV